VTVIDLGEDVNAVEIMLGEDVNVVEALLGEDVDIVIDVGIIDCVSVWNDEESNPALFPHLYWQVSLLHVTMGVTNSYSIETPLSKMASLLVTMLRKEQSQT
jgi:hypothetical protein